MSFEVLDAVFRESRFRYSLNHSEKKKIRKFLSDPIHRKFTSAKFQQITGVIDAAESVLNAIVDWSVKYIEDNDTVDDVYLLFKDTEYICPSDSHDSVVLEVRNSAKGWCFECGQFYELSDHLSHEVVFTRKWDAYESELESKPQASFCSRAWRQLRIHWKFAVGTLITIVLFVIGILLSLFMYLNPYIPRSEDVSPTATVMPTAGVYAPMTTTATTAVEAESTRDESTQTVPAVLPRFQSNDQRIP